MAKGVFLGAGSVRTSKKMWIGEGGVRKVKKIFAGAGGVKAVYSADPQKVAYVAPLTAKRYEGFSGSSDNYALITGGYDYGGTYGIFASVDVYNSSLVRSTASPLVIERFDGAGAGNSTHIMFAGGQWSSYNSPSSYGGAVDAYDGTSLVKTMGDNTYGLSKGVIGVSGLSFGNYIMFAGGMADVQNKGYTTYADVWVYDNSLVRTIYSLSSHRFRIAAEVVGNYALFAGGRAYGVADYLPGTVDVFNQSLVRSSAALLSSKGIKKGADTGNYALFAGGVDQAVVDVYNTSLVKSVATPLSDPRFPLGGEGVGGYAIFASGARDYRDYAPTVECYDSSLVRSNLENVGIARDSGTSVSFGNYALFAGGLTGTTSRTEVDAYEV